MPHPFYTIRPEAYLFSKKLKEENGDFEETVRQWCLSELQSTYGICVSNIEIEFPCKVGSKNYYADILVKNNDKPYIVIECKKRSFSKHEHAIEQAISYADSASIKAELAIYTNGNIWIVRRKISETWVGIPDIPIFSDRATSIDICHAMSLIKELWPILHCIKSPVKSKDAKEYLSAWQSFFCGGNILTSLNDFNLVIAADNFFRVAWGVDSRDGYLYEKINNGCVKLKEYAKTRNLDFSAHKSIRDNELSWIARLIEIDLDLFLEKSKDIQHPDVLLLRFISTLMRYIQESLRIKPRIFLKNELHAPVPQYLQDEAIKYIRCVLKLTLNWSLPDDIDDIRWSDIRKYTKYSWETYPDLINDMQKGW